MIRNAKRNSGFALLLVLLVLAVAGTVLAAAARRSGLEALRAHSAQRDLQLRWGALSCRATVLPRASEILDERATTVDPIILEARAEVTLGGIRFAMIVADELGKANANFLADRRGQVALSLALRNLQLLDKEPIPVEPRPSAAAIAQGSTIPIRYYSFDQLLELDSPEQLVGDADGEDGSALRRTLTCWGNGSLNVRRADVPAMRAVLGDIMSDSQLAALDDLRRSSPNLLPPEMWPYLGMTQAQARQANQRVIPTSNCYSLWVIVEDRTRNWYRFYVQDESKPAADDRGELSFAW